MKTVAIYDLDGTLTRTPTFTPFLIFAARKRAPWRLTLLPIWLLAMASYKLDFFSRKRLKTFGMRLLVGRADDSELYALGEAFARHHLKRSGTNPAVMEMLENDRGAGHRLVIATAAFEFYATAFAKHVTIPDVIATRWSAGRFQGRNCHDVEKLARLKDWLKKQHLAAADVHLRFVSDSFADAPLLDWADEAIFVTESNAKARRARERGWRLIFDAEQGG